jgi:superfamily II DNA or RNA helicase
MIREVIQKEAIQSLIFNNFQGIIHISPRVGKTKILLESLEAYDGEIYVIYPTNDIKASWLEEMEKWNLYFPITFYNQRSLHKINSNKALIICDEIHTLSMHQIELLKKLKQRGCKLAGASGTISRRTLEKLQFNLGLEIIYEYIINDAIDDNIIADYEIIVYRVPLDDTKKDVLVKRSKKDKGFYTTEARAYKFYDDKFFHFKSKEYETSKILRNFKS